MLFYGAAEAVSARQPPVVSILLALSAVAVFHARRSARS